MLFLFLLIDGSAVEGKLKTPTVAFETKYGRMIVPVSDIANLDFGIHFASGQRTKIQSLIADLGNSDYKTREAAALELRKHKRWAKHELRLLKEPLGLEAAMRVKVLLSHLADEPDQPEVDRLLTESADMQGRVLDEEFEVESATIGTVKLKTHQIVAMRSVAGMTQEVKVDAKDVWQHPLRVFPGDRVTLTAVGLVDLYPSDRGKWTCGPRGHTSNGKGWNYSAGRLLVKLEGDVYSVGDGEGVIMHVRSHAVLEFLVVPPSWEPQDMTGHYNVTVRRKR